MVEEYDVQWTDYTINVSIERDSFVEGQCHVEVRCKEPLPITTTGYRSLFMAEEQLANYENVPSFILAWLDHAAKSKDWKRLVEDRAQLRFLF